MPAPRRLRTKEGLLNQIGPQLRRIMDSRSFTNDDVCIAVSTVTKGEWVMQPIDVTHLLSGRRIVSSVELIAMAKALEVRASVLLGEE